MADRYWVGGSDNWNSTAGSKWSATSGGAGGAAAPTAADDVFFDASSSGTVTLTSTTVARSINCTGFTGTISHASGVVPNLGDATAGASNIALKLVSGMTYTLGSATTSGWNFISTSATQQTVDTGGKTQAFFTFNGVGGSWILASNITMGTNAANAITITNGAFDTGNFNFTGAALISSNANVRSVSLGSSVISLTVNGNGGLQFLTTTNLTFNAGTSNVTVNTSNYSFQPGALVWYDMTYITGNGTGTYNSTGGGSTFHNFTVTLPLTSRWSLGADITVTNILELRGFAEESCGIVLSSQRGVQRTITAASAIVQDLHLQDVVAAGASAPWTGTQIGNAGNCSGVTFSTPKTRYWVGGTAGVGSGNTRDKDNWAVTSGGAGNNTLPLAQDTVVFDANSFPSGGCTITIDSCCIPTFDFTNATNDPTVTFSLTNGNIHPFGDFILKSGMSTTGTTQLLFCNRGQTSIRSNGVTFSNALGIDNGLGIGSVVLLDAAIFTGNFTMTSGTFNTQNFSFSCATVIASSVVFMKELLLGTSTINLTSTATSTLLNCTATNMNLDADECSVVVSTASANTRTINFGTGNVWGDFTYTVAGSTGTLATGTSSNIRNFNFSDASNARTLTLAQSSTSTIRGQWNVFGTSGNLITLNSSSGTNHIINSSKSISVDYLSISDSTITGGFAAFAGANSVDGGGGNVGWTFAAPRTSNHIGLLGVS